MTIVIQNKEMTMNLIQSVGLVAAGTLVLAACATSPQTANERPAMTDRKQQVVELLKSIESGDRKPLAYINSNKYLQHNLAAGDGMAGLNALLQSLPKGSARVNTV